MRRSIVMLFCFAVFLTFTACGGNAGDDPKAFLNETLDVLDNYITDMGKVENADDAVAVTEKYTAIFKDLGERGKVLKEKHPELFEGMEKNEYPEGYEDVEERMKQVMPKMMAMFQNEKMMEIMQDPKVQEAQMKFQEAMQSIND